MGVWTRIKLAFAAFFTILFKGRLPAALQTPAHEPDEAPAAVVAPAAPAADAKDDADRAVQVMSLLQREGRLIDFVMEDLAAYSDAQIGAAARDVHGGCRRVIERYLSLEPILSGIEGQPTEVGDGLDPATVRLVGNVTGRPPFRGTLLHRGWRVTRVDLPPVGAPPTRRIVAQAEVEVA